MNEARSCDRIGFSKEYEAVVQQAGRGLGFSHRIDHLGFDRDDYLSVLRMRAWIAIRRHREAHIAGPEHLYVCKAIWNAKKTLQALRTHAEWRKAIIEAFENANSDRWVEDSVARFEVRERLERDFRDLSIEEVEALMESDPREELHDRGLSNGSRAVRARVTRAKAEARARFAFLDGRAE